MFYGVDRVFWVEVGELLHSCIANVFWVVSRESLCGCYGVLGVFYGIWGGC